MNDTSGNVRWNRAMDLRHLKHFLAAGEAGSITAAAKKLRLTQPALSRQTKPLRNRSGGRSLHGG